MENSLLYDQQALICLGEYHGFRMTSFRKLRQYSIYEIPFLRSTSVLVEKSGERAVKRFTARHVSVLLNVRVKASMFVFGLAAGEYFEDVGSRSPTLAC